MLSAMKSTTVKNTVSVQRVPVQMQVQQPRKPLIFQWVQDVSGSMSGSGIDASLKGLEYTVEKVLQDQDMLGLTTFNSKSKMIHRPIRKEKLDLSRDIQTIRNSVGGGTSIYDALHTSITALKEMVLDSKFVAISKDAVYELLLVTDGADGNSKFTLQEAIELVKHPGIPNFHLIVVAVGMTEHDKIKLIQLCQCSHAEFISVKHLHELRETIQTLGHQILQRLVYVTTSVTTTTTNAIAAQKHKTLSYPTLPLVHSNIQKMDDDNNNNNLSYHLQCLSLQTGNKHCSKISSSASISTGISNKQCHFYKQQGICKNGMNCKFLHS